MAKYYFSDNEEERCYTIDYFREQLNDGLNELTVYPAQMVTGLDAYYCKFFGEIGEVGEGCGKICSEYKPRNGKNGRCIYSNNCYEPMNNKPQVLRLNQ